MAKNYKIVHTLVGPWPNGRVISDDEIRRFGSDPEYLLSRGAIEATGDSVTRAPLPIGPEHGPLAEQGRHPLGPAGRAALPGEEGYEGPNESEAEAVQTEPAAEPKVREVNVPMPSPVGATRQLPTGSTAPGSRQVAATTPKK